MDRENIMFFENDDESYTMVDQYLDNNRFFGYKDSYNYDDFDVDNILLFKKSDNEYIIRYNNINKMKIAPLQSKIKNFYGKLHKLKNNITLMSIESVDKELLKKIREIWNKIIELIGIDNAKDFVKTALDGYEFIMVDVHKNTGFVEDNYRNKLVIVLHSVIDNYLKTSLIQAKINAHK